MREIILLIVVFTCVLKNNAVGQYWSAIGEGVGYPDWLLVPVDGPTDGYDGPVTGSPVASFCIYNGELYAAGFFDYVNGPASNIAKWNGTSWQAIPGVYTVGGGGLDSWVNALLVYKGELYVAGRFTNAGNIEANNVAKWNGTQWSTVGAGLGTYGYSVSSLAIYNDELYAGGHFYNSDSVPMNNIAKWNGTQWSPVGNGIDVFMDCFPYGSVNSLVVHNGELYAGGNFDTVGVNTRSHILKWNDTSWSAAGAIDSMVFSLAIYNGELYACGYFSSVKKWDGNNWTPLASAINGSVYTLSIYNESLIAGGHFDTAGVVAAKNIAKWDGNNWSSIGNGMNSGVSSMITYNGSLLAGGNFSRAGNVWANRVARWTEQCNSVPAQPTGIIGSRSVCGGQNVVYYIDPVTDAADFTWTLPNGWTGSSISNRIVTLTGMNGGTISVTANNACGSSIAQTLDVTINSAPQPGLIIGSDSICQFTSASYSVNPVDGATSYTWNLPAGWLGISNSNSITVETGSNSGSISVVANNSCGASIPQTMPITTVAIPSVPALIYGNDTVCEGSAQTYFIDPVAGATGYAWDLTFGTAFGLDSTTITITALHSGYPEDFITVSAYNNCGNSDMLTLPVKVSLLPHQPNRIIGNNLVCRGSNQTYFIDTVPGATSYTWIIPTGWIGNSNSSSINVDVGNETGKISVRANNSCGSGAFVSLPIFFDTIPSKPGPINGNAYVAAGEKHGYSVDIANRPSGYSWSLSGGGNLTVGQSPHKIEIDWQTPGTYVLSVSAVNSCGISTEQKMNITVSGAHEKDPYGLQLTPNPSTGQFFLKAKKVQDKLIKVEVLNMAGQLVFRSGQTQGTNNYSQLINLDKMPIGLYAVKIMIDDKTYGRSVMINH